MPNPSHLALELIDAYRAADYWIFEPLVGEYVLCRVGTPSEPIARMLKHDGLEGAAYMTAYNPAPHRPCSTDFNKRQNWDLLQMLLQLGGMAHQAFSSAAGSSLLHREEGFLILNITRDIAEDLGRAFQQDAILRFDVPGTAELVLLV